MRGRASSAFLRSPMAARCFLDEVMEMPMQLQSKLLRALETRSFFRVGGVKKVEVDVRLVAATNRDKSIRPIADGIFRSDLMYRINSFEINIPPLRERREDIEPLARHLLHKLAGQNAPELSPRGDRGIAGILTGRATSASFATVSNGRACSSTTA